ncbi:MAG: ABC transporter substrate-binding protein [Chitinispirillales bacterium]|jgi:peptide/nickel transport system substrate-binding protein|nr:ABC transporter substrate-binding protein [Chitinispirillales bacterium]
MKCVTVLKRLVVGAALLGLVSCGGGKDSGGGETAGGGSESGFARGKTLYLAGSQWGDPNTFNPLAESWQAAWPVNDKFNLMYETILSYNSLDGKFEPLLGTLVSRDNDKVVVDLNPNAKWSDGQPVTSADVKFVFELGRRFPGAATAFAIDFISGIKVETIDGGVERLSFMVDKTKRNNPLVILDHLQAIRIVPAHVFEKLLADNGNDLGAVQKLKIDKDPVISGPYNIEHYSNERIVIRRRGDYWGNEALYGGKLPAPEYIIHPIYKNNDHFAIALQKGDIDASQTFMPRIWLKKKDGVSTWYDDAPYFVPGAMPMLLINTTKAPLNDPQFRRAMAAAISYADIKELAVSGYAPDVQPGLIMNQGLEGKYFNAEDAKEFGVTCDPENAKKILAAAGYKSVFKSDGSLDYMTDKAGNKLPTMSITVPAGWSDWEAMVKIAEKGFRAAGMDIREGPVDASLYWPALPSGNFDLIMHKPAASVTPSLPWNRFESVMSSRNWVPVGGDNKMNENQGRYNSPKDKGYNPKVDELLKKIPTLEKEEDLAVAYRELNRIFMKDQPSIPLCYLPEQFYEFSSKAWTNWPTSANPYAPPLLPMVGASTKILWGLQPAK